MASSNASNSRTDSDESCLSLDSTLTTDTALTIPLDDLEEDGKVSQQEKTSKQGGSAQRSVAFRSRSSSSLESPSNQHSRAPSSDCGAGRLDSGTEEYPAHSPSDLQRPPTQAPDSQEPQNDNDDLQSLERQPSRRDSLVQLSITFLGINTENWKGILLLHIALSLMIHAYELGIGTYSAFWGCPTQAIDTKMQKVLQAVESSKLSGSNETLAELAQLKKWETFNKWIISCAAYAKQNVTSDRCKGALEAFDRPPPFLPNTSPQSLGKRHLHELAGTLSNATGISYFLSDAHERHVDNVTNLSRLTTICLGLTFVLLLAIFSERFNQKLTFLRGKWKSSKQPLPTAKEYDEKTDAPKNASSVSAVRIKSTGINEVNRGTARRRKETSRALDASNIWYAATQGDARVVASMLQRGECPDINTEHEVYGTLLHAAAQSGKPEVVKIVLKANPDPNVTGGRFHTPLQAAAYANSIEISNFLLDRGAKVNMNGGIYGNPLNAAADRGSSELVKRLLQEGADPNVKGGSNSYPLHSAAYRGNNQMVELLLAFGADTNSEGEQFKSPLHATFSQATPLPSIAQGLLDKGADPNVVSETTGTPLQMAVQNGQQELALLLLTNGANCSVLDQDRKSLLHHAARTSRSRLLEHLLCDRGLDVNAQDADGCTPLHQAAISGHTDIVNILLNYGADVCAADKFGAHPLFRSAGLHHNAITGILLAKGSPPDARDCFGRTALHGPAADDDVTCQELLLKHGADVNIVGSDNKTPLHEAANVGNLANVRLLLRQPGVKTSLQDNDQKTPLNRAIDHIGTVRDSHGNPMETVHEAIALELLDAADVDINARSGSALQEALARNRPDIVSKILSLPNASVQIPGGRYGGTVQAAVRSGNPALLAMILAKGGNVNTPGGEFGSALQAAAYMGDIDMVEALLEQGADVNAVGGKWGCVMNAARKSPKKSEEEREQVLSLLKEYDAKDLPVNSREKEEWRLGMSGYGWQKPETWDVVEDDN